MKRLSLSLDVDYDLLEELKSDLVSIENLIQEVPAESENSAEQQRKRLAKLQGLLPKFNVYDI